MYHKSLPKPVCFSFDVPEHWAWEWKERQTQIVLVELVAPLLAFETWKECLKGRTIIFFNVSSAAENILVKGYSNSAYDANGMVAEFWRLAAELDACAYIDRVPTDMNPSDGCSRGKASEDALKYGWELSRIFLHSRWIDKGPGMREAKG